MAITIDDIPVSHSLPASQTRVGLVREVMDTLQAEQVPAFGFVNAGLATTPDTLDAMNLWATAFPVGNHTWSHVNADKANLAQYQQNIARNEPVLDRLSPGRDWHWFRYPYLVEGADATKKAAIRRYLADHGYRIADVTIDTTDWAYDEPYVRCLAQRDAVSTLALEDDLVATAHRQAREFQMLSQSVYGRQVPAVVLLHLGAIDGPVLPRLLAEFRGMGYEFVSLEQAQADPAYAQDNDPTLPAGPGIFAARVSEKDLPQPVKQASTVDLDNICR